MARQYLSFAAGDLSQPVLKAEGVKMTDYFTALALRIANASARPKWNDDSYFRRFAEQ